MLPTVSGPVDGRSYINHLPDELLSEIFKIYNENVSGKRLVLLLVCKTWHDVVQSTMALWAKICFGPARMIRKLDESPDHDMMDHVLCSTPRQVARAIERLGPTVTFAFTCFDIGDSYWEVMDPGLFERCKKLSVAVDNPYQKSPPFRNLKMLEELKIEGVEGLFMDLLEEVQRSSPKLHRLEVESLAPYRLKSYPDLLGRLRTLLMDNDGTDPESFSQILQNAVSLTNISALQENIQGGAHPSYTVGSRVLSEMSLYDLGYVAFHATAYHNVTFLEIVVIEKTDLNSATSYGKITMPVLDVLTLDGMWLPMTTITAPKLGTLRLRKCYESPQARLQALLETSLRPRILRINASIAESDLAAAFRSSFADIQELHLILSTRNDYLKPRLVQELSGVFGRSRKEPLCPFVWNFSVLSTIPTKDHMDRIERTKAGARQIAAGRKGLGNLKVLRCGWVPQSERWNNRKLDEWFGQGWIDFV